MVEPLTPGPPVFDLDEGAFPARTAQCPGCCLPVDLQVVVIRHACDSRAAHAELRRLDIAWPVDVHQIQGEGPFALRRSADEILVVGSFAAAGILGALWPSAANDAVAIDLTHGTLVFELEGPRLDEWLSRLIDVDALPREPKRGARTRVIDIAVVVLRLALDRVWLVADRAHATYLADWLRYAHEGAFGGVE